MGCDINVRALRWTIAILATNRMFLWSMCRKSFPGDSQNSTTEDDLLWKKDSEPLNLPLHPEFSSLQSALLPVVTPWSHPQATLSENISTGAYFLYPAVQPTSMWFWNSHVYPSNPYQYSVTCMWISGPYLTQGTRSLWKRIPNVTVHKHALLLQQAWGLQEPPESTSDFHKRLSLGWYKSNRVCLCCYHVDVFGYQCLGYQFNSTVRLSP